MKNMKIFIQVLLALYHLHRMKCIHNQINTENILFTSDDKIKIIGFDSMNNFESKRIHSE